MATDNDKLTFAEQQEAQVIDWPAFLANPPAEGNYAAWRDARKAAGSWVTCACGNQCAVLPRGTAGRPMDRELARLGQSFYDAISDKYVKGAQYVLGKIEERSAYLLTCPNYTDPND